MPKADYTKYNVTKLHVRKCCLRTKREHLRQVLLPVHARPAYELLGACLTQLSRDWSSGCHPSHRGSLPSLCPEVICSVVHSWQGFPPSFPTAVQWKQFNLLLKITGRKRTSVTTGGLRLKSAMLPYNSWNSMWAERPTSFLSPRLAERYHIARVSRGQTFVSTSGVKVCLLRRVCMLSGEFKGGAAPQCTSRKESPKVMRTRLKIQIIL